MAGVLGYKLEEDNGSGSFSLTPLVVKLEELDETNDLGEKLVVPLQEMLEFNGLLDSLPRSSVTEDIQVLERVYVLATDFNPIRITLGDNQGAFYSILNSTSLEKSHVDVSLQNILLHLMTVITQNAKVAKKVVQNYNYFIPFLVGCLSSNSIENRDDAAYLVNDLAEFDSGFSRKIGESGAVTSMIHIIGEDHEVGKPDAITAMLQFCLKLENRELAVSNGVTTAVMKKVVRRVRVEQMLQTLEILSKHQKAIVEMEKYGILKSLSEILGEDVGERAKEYCVDIIHAICHASSAINVGWQINEVENARQTLERLARVGTKAHEVLLKLRNGPTKKRPRSI